MSRTLPRALMALCVVLGPWLPACGGDDLPMDVADVALQAPGEEEATPADIETPEPQTTPRWPTPDPSIYKVVDVSSSAVLRGSVSAAIEGAAPTYATPDGSQCDPADLPRRFATGPLPGAVVWLEGVAHGLALDMDPPAIVAAGCKLAPRVQLAPLGSELTMSSSDGVAQVFQLVGWRRSGTEYHDYGQIGAGAGGESVARRLRVPGLVLVREMQRADSRAWIYVTDHPYVAITGPDGTFRLAGVPPRLDGDSKDAKQAPPRTLHVWHEAFGETTRGVEPKATGEVLFDILLGG